MIFFLLIALICISLGVGSWVASAPILFLAASAAIVPMAEYIRRATDQIAKLAGPATGGLLNVTFGNTAELILAVFVLRTGAKEVVKGQIAGSIVGNGLLALGLAIVVGSWGKEKVSFHRQRAALLASLLILTMIALLVPALFDYTERHLLSNPNATQLAERLSLCVSIVLIFLYVANLFYTFITHRDVFVIATEASHADWSWARSIGVLALATIGIAVESHFVAQTLGKTAESLGVTSLFLGVVVLAVIGNVADYVAAMYFAHRNQMPLAVSITIGSSIQIALVVAPLLVIISFLMGTPMSLVFANPLELVAIAAVAFVVSTIARNGQASWFEGVMLLSVYTILSLAFFFVQA